MGSQKTIKKQKREKKNNYFNVIRFNMSHLLNNN